MLEGVIESFIGTLLAGLLLITPFYFVLKRKIENYNPMAAVFGNQE